MTTDTAAVRARLPEHLRGLPVYHGLPVPWVVIWTAEQRADLQCGWTQQGLYAIGADQEHRFGMTLLAVPNTPLGEPVFTETHSRRQRMCMLGPRCQVCGTRLPKGQPVPFILPHVADVQGLYDHEGVTQTPPVCEACLDAAPLWCPHLRRNPPGVVWAVPVPVRMDGDLATPRGMKRDVSVPLDDPMRKWVLGRQVVVRLDP